MTGSVALDIVISLVFIYLLYSLLATILQEIVASVVNLRGKVLEECIRRMLDDDDSSLPGDLLSKTFYASPLIKYLGQTPGKKPAYLMARNFSKVLLDILKGPNPLPGDDFKKKIDDSFTHGIMVSGTHRIAEGDTFRHLKTLWADAHGDIDRFRPALEQWFDDAMARATGWFRRKTQTLLMIIGFCIAIIFNVDTIELTRKLSRDPELAAKVAQQADNFLQAHPNLAQELEQQKKAIAAQNLAPEDSVSQVADATERYEALKNKRDSLLMKADSLINGDIKSVNGLLGTGIQSYVWRGDDVPSRIGYFLLSIVGWALTALAISLGAPFWFDLLNKLMKLRRSVPAAPDDTATGSAKDKKGIIIKG